MATPATPGVQVTMPPSPDKKPPPLPPDMPLPGRPPPGPPARPVPPRLAPAPGEPGWPLEPQPIRSIARRNHGWNLRSFGMGGPFDALVGARRKMLGGNFSVGERVVARELPGEQQ